MKRLILIFLFAAAQALGAYTEFYAQSGGSNLNAGSTTTNGATLTYVSAVVVGGWDSATGIFTVASGDPVADGVAVGNFASVYVTAGATVATFIARVTARDTTTITVSLTAVSGTPPATDALGVTTMKVGGAWAIPATTVGFALTFPAATMTNAAADIPRVNLLGTSTISAAITRSAVGPVRFQGYASTPGDGLGRFVLDAAGANITIFTCSGANNDFADMTVSNNGTGTATGWNLTGGEITMTRCVAFGIRGTGFVVAGTNTVLIACEAYLCNVSSTASLGGFSNAGTAVTFIRCISHDNLAGDTDGHGFVSSVAATFINCIADSNGGSGFLNSATTSGFYFNCDAYNNGADGITMTGASAATFVVENCNFINNTGWGINSSGSTVRNGTITNCGFGSGTQANDAGTTNGTGGILISGSVTYAADVTPYNAPTTGDFRLTLGAARTTGYGAFTQTQSAYTGTSSSPDIGAAHIPAQTSSGSVK